VIAAVYTLTVRAVDAAGGDNASLEKSRPMSIPSTMRALQQTSLNGPQDTRLVLDVPVPVPVAGEVLIRAAPQVFGQVMAEIATLIATNVCLTALEWRHARVLPSGIAQAYEGPDRPPTRPPPGEVSWLEPFPDHWVAAPASDPSAVIVARESLRLALIAVYSTCQHVSVPSSSSGRCWPFPQLKLRSS
jgi:hypothetical protein